ncbi:RING-H2 FINGER PROTEIN ATL51-RELATED [Salix viminalis]|uniref:RING-type E3 ubiquitin transferase n=1 Tax=Salix viminalis TaxID=40686 RepID=A0A9Q0QC65_SALVM|nr:RING-H2 FINGER PROTEIN ATL51-RELATED [Salix viminalis]
MASLDAPKTWVPYVNNKDCSQGFCSLYCPQWCYTIFPPPPPFEFPDDNSSPNRSPLVIAIVGILASAFLLVCYCTIISKYCGNDDSARRRGQNHGQNEEFEDDHNSSLHEPRHAAASGLDEALIRSITVCKYKKGDGLIEGTDCSVCLSEFEEDESIRLLPKCSHAFHKLLEAMNLCKTSNELMTMRLLHKTRKGFASDERAIQNLAGAPKTPSRVSGDLGNLEERDIVIEMRDIDRYRRFRRSFSMDRPCQSHTPIAEIIRMNQDEFVPVEDCSGDVGSSGHSAEIRKCMSSSRRVLHCVLNPVAMKRSFSSGRLFLTGHGRVRDTISLV